SPFLQNSTLKAGLGYRFSDRVQVAGDFRQIVQGHNFGDYLYEAQVDLLLSNSVGKIQLGAYTQNKSPEQVYERMDYTYHQWEQGFEKTKTTNFPFSYQKERLKFRGRAEYVLI